MHDLQARQRRVREQFELRFGGAPAPWGRAPGRVDPMGSGLSASAALECATATPMPPEVFPFMAAAGAGLVAVAEAGP